MPLCLGAFCVSDTRVKVLFVLPDLNGGGAERVVLTVSRHLDRERIDPSIFLLRNDGVYWDEIPADTCLAYGTSRPGPLKYRAFDIFKNLQRETVRNDIVIGALELLPSYFACISGALSRKPMIGWVHTDLDSHLSTYRRGWIHRRAVKSLYPMFQNIVLPSRSASDSFLGAVPIASGKTEVIHNPLDSVMVKSKATEHPPDWADAVFKNPTVIALGRLNIQQKGFDLLIQAHAEIVLRGVDSNLLILGEGPDRQYLEQLSQQLGVRESVHMPGYQQNPYPLIQRARALVVPSRYEGFGMVVLEAMALGVPVICLNSACGPVEILEAGTYGMCVPNGGPSSLASAMQELASNPILHQRYSALGRKRAESFQPEPIARQWKELICSAVASNSH